MRSRTRFAPLPTGSSLTEQLRFRDPVVLLRASFRLSFAYAGPDRVWKSTWREAEQLPVMIKLIIRDAASQRVLGLDDCPGPYPGAERLRAAGRQLHRQAE